MRTDQRGLVVNVDGDALWYISNMTGQKYDNIEAELRAYAARYAGHGITDMVYSISGLCSSVPSKVLTFYGDKTEWTTENGIPVDYSSHDRIRPYREIYDTGVDAYRVILDETKKQGMNAWVSVRMNDCHENDKQTSFLRGQLFYDALNGGMMLTDAPGIPGYFRTCLNYAKPFIRRTMLDYIAEQVEHLDPDGLELDFQREIFCFDYLREKDAVRIMNGFMEDVHRILCRHGEKTGRRPKLAVRLLRDIAQNAAMGFDAAAWVKAGWVDALVPTPRWGTCDHDMPIAAWKALAGDRVEIWAGQELLCAVGESASGVGMGTLVQNAETAKGFAAQYFEAGADRAYLFNFYQTCFPGEDREGVLWAAPVWEGCKDNASALSGTRRHIAGYQDICPEGFPRFAPFPIRVEGAASFTLKTGAMTADDTGILYLALAPDTDAEAPCVTVGGETAEYLGESDGSHLSACVARLADEAERTRAAGWARVLAYRLPAGDRQEAVVTVTSSTPRTLHCAEIRVN